LPPEAQDARLRDANARERVSDDDERRSGGSAGVWQHGRPMDP
jgi:hypothetical protein